MSGKATGEIDATLSRIARANADGYGILIRRRKGPGEGWFRAADLIGGEDVAAILLTRVRGMSEPPPDHIKAEWMVESLARAAADLAGSFLVSARRLPDLSPENVLFAAEGGLVRASGVASDRMIMLADDPAAAQAAEVVDDWTDLADRFHDGFMGLLAPIVEWIDGLKLRPAKTVWHAAADRLAQSMVWQGKAFESHAFARQVTERVIDREGPLRIPLETAEDEYGEDYHLRATCCLAYRTPEGMLCQACPINKDRTEAF